MQSIVTKNQVMSQVANLGERAKTLVVDLGLKIVAQMSSDLALRELSDAQRRDASIDQTKLDQIEARARPLIR